MAVRKRYTRRSSAKNKSGLASGTSRRRSPQGGRRKSFSLPAFIWLLFVIIIFILFILNQKEIRESIVKLQQEILSRGPADVEQIAEPLSSTGTGGREAPSPAVTQTPPPPAVTQTPPPPAATQSPPPAVTQTPPPAATQSPPPAVTQTPPPAVTQAPPPAVTQSPAPAATPPPSPPASQAPSSQAPAETPATLYERSIYFIQVDSGGNINRVRVSRRMPASASPMTDALRALIAGPSMDEMNRGLISLIPPAVRIISATVTGNTAFVNFSEDFMYNTYGVEGYQEQVRQVVLTATEFTNVNNVQILIEGQQIDYLGEGIWIGSPLSR